MVPVTKEEKKLLKKKYPDLCIARTMRQKSSRHNYYCEERPGAMAYLERIRQKGVVYDSRYPNGIPPKKEEKAPWKQDGRNNRQGKSGKQYNNERSWKDERPDNTGRNRSGRGTR